MSNKAIRGVMSPAELSLGTEKWAELPFIYFHCYFRETTWIVNLGIFQILSPHILPFFFSPGELFRAARVPKSQELGSAQVPQAPQKVPKPEERLWQLWHSQGQDGTMRHQCGSGTAGQGRARILVLLCGPAPINLISSLNHFTPLPCPKKQKNSLFPFPSCLLRVTQSFVATTCPSSGTTDLTLLLGPPRIPLCGGD